MKNMTKIMIASVVAVGTLAAGCQTTPKALVVKKLHHYSQRTHKSSHSHKK